MFERGKNFYWGAENWYTPDGTHLIPPTTCDHQDNACDREAYHFEKDHTYDFEIKFERECELCKNEVIIMINDGNINGVARFDMGFGDYFCENYQDMLVTLGNDVDMHSSDTLNRHFINLEATVYDLRVEGLCPVEKHPKEACCPGAREEMACLATKNFVTIENWGIDGLNGHGHGQSGVVWSKGAVGESFDSSFDETTVKCRRDVQCIGFAYNSDLNQGQLVYAINDFGVAPNTEWILHLDEHVMFHYGIGKRPSFYDGIMFEHYGITEDKFSRRGKFTSICFHEKCMCHHKDSVDHNAAYKHYMEVGGDERPECHHFDFNNFNACQDFDQNDCSNCDKKVVLIGNNEDTDAINLKDMKEQVKL